MAILSDLVTNLARVSGLPEATVFAYGRFARQAGAIAQKGRGRAAAAMGAKDAANLLIAIGGTDVTREAGEAIKLFRPLHGHIIAELIDSTDEIFLDWLRPLGLKPYEVGGLSFYELQITFGRFLEFLFDQCSSGGLLLLCRRLPVVLTIVFDRTACTVEVAFIRKDDWGVPQTAFSIFFRKSPPTPQKGDLNVKVSLTMNLVAALAATLEGRVIPAKIKSREQFSEFFFPSAISDGQKLEEGTP